MNSGEFPMGEEGLNFKMEEESSVEFETELDTETKKTLSRVWADLVVDVDVPNEIENYSNNEIIDWLSESVAKDTDALLKEWELVPSQQALEDLKKGEDPKEKSQLEIGYIQSALDQFREKRKILLKQAPKRTNKWDSWPKIMREERGFNCVGASLLADRMLAQAGIEVTFGSPEGHAMNVATLSDGSRWYIDFNNSIIKPLEASTENIEDYNVLAVDDPKIGYKKITLLERSEMPRFILENLESLKTEASENPDELTGSARAEFEESSAYYNKHRELLEKINFFETVDSLYPNATKLLNHPIIQEEKNRVIGLERLREIERPVYEYVDSLELSEDQQEALVEEVRDNADLIGSYLLGDEENPPQGISEVATNVLEKLRASIDAAEARESGIKQRKVSELLNRWKRA